MSPEVGDEPIVHPTLRGKVDVCFARHVSIEEPHWDIPHLVEGEEIELVPGLKASCLTKKLRRVIGEACGTRNFRRPPTADPGLTYGFVRENAPERQFDPDRLVSRTLALSRLIHSSQHGFDYCGSLYFDPSGKLETMYGLSGEAAYNCRDERSWLTPAELTDLGALLRAYEALPVIHELPPANHPWWKEPPQTSRKLPRRLHRAMWNLAYAARVQPSHIRWLIVATAAEGIIETGKQARQEFIGRRPAISEEIGLPMARKQADTIYDLRSAVAHSGWFVGKTDDELDGSYMPLERFVAGVIRKAIYEAEFRAHFEDRDSVMKRWPVERPVEIT